MSHESNEAPQTIIVRDGHFENNTTAPSNNILNVDGSIDFSNINFTSKQVDIIAIHFASFSDGRGFSLAKLLRTNGFEGILRAKGDILSDQYPLIIRCGFSEVEISQTHAKRQPEKHWQETFKRITNTYLDRLMA